jgi:hypothetical protein
MGNKYTTLVGYGISVRYHDISSNYKSSQEHLDDIIRKYRSLSFTYSNISDEDRCIFISVSKKTLAADMRGSSNQFYQTNIDKFALTDEETNLINQAAKELTNSNQNYVKFGVFTCEE